MTETVTIAFNAVTAKLHEPSKEVRQIVQEMLSYIVEGVGFSNAFTKGSWNGKSSFYSMRANTFPAGFVHMVQRGLGAKGYAVRLAMRPHHKPLGPEIVRPEGRDTRYDYQFDALDAVERYGRGIIQIATGGGKSRIAELIGKRYQRMTLFLTTRSVLLHQMRDHYTRAGINCGVIGDGEMTLVRGLNAGMVQTCAAALKESSVQLEMTELLNRNWEPRAEMLAEAERRFAVKEKARLRMQKILSLFEVVIGEEAHEAGGNSYFQILKACTNASIRVALTATPFMRADAEDNMKLMAAFGDTIIKVSEKQLIDCGILAKPYFRFVSTGAPPKLKKSTPYASAVTLGYSENIHLNNAVVKDALMARQRGMPVLTLVQRRTHGTLLRDMMRAQGLRAEYIQGENDMETRRKALNKLAEGETDVLIGTTIVDVGVDVPSIGLVQLAGGGKAEVALRQRIGRGARAKKTGENVFFVADYTPQTNTHLLSHARERRAIITATPGFVEGILADGAAFPWDKFPLVDVKNVA